MRALLALALLCLSGCSFLTDDSAYRCGSDAGCMNVIDSAIENTDAGADAVVARGCDTNTDCAGSTPFCSSDGRCLACQPHRFCGDDAKSLCIDDGASASCQLILDPTNVKACDATFPRDLATLKGSDVFTVGLIARLPNGLSKSSYGLPSTQAVEVAVSSINNDNSGLPNSRKLLVIQCNEDALTQEAANARSGGNYADLAPAVDHLQKTLRVPAIIGGSTSSVTSRVNATLLTGDTLLVSPSATDDSIVDTWRRDRTGTTRQLFWRTVAPDSQQVPALKAAIDQVQTTLRASSDAGIPTVSGTNDLNNSATRALPDLFATQDPRVNLNSVGYKPGDAAYNATAVQMLVSRQSSIIVPLGIGDFVISSTNGMSVSLLAQVEATWIGMRKPWYVMSEGSRTDFKLALTMFPNLAERVLGTAPGARSDPLYQTFLNAYKVVYPGSEPGNLAESGYDAMYMIAYASVLATATLGPSSWPTGTDLVNAVEKFSCKSQPLPLQASSGNFTSGANTLASLNAGGCFDFQGASGPIDYAENPLSTKVPKSKDPSADIALWCLGNPTANGDQTTTMKYYYQQSTRSIAGVAGAPKLEFGAPGWCRAASGL